MSEQIYITDQIANANPSTPSLVPEYTVSETVNANQEIFKQIESENINREFIFETFKGLGETVEHHGFNPNEKRNLTYQQYFTPYLVVEFITKALNLDSGKDLIIFDNSAGIGRMFRYLHPSTRIIGIEKEEGAYKVCKALYPKNHGFLYLNLN